MHRLLAAALTSVVAAGLAVGAGFGIVAALDATPDQPNVPLVHFHSSPEEVPGLGGSALPSASPSGSAAPDGSGSGDGGPSGSPRPSEGGGTDPDAASVSPVGSEPANSANSATASGPAPAPGD